MRIFLAGATRVIGMRLVPLLLDAGHEVAGMTRSPGKPEALRKLGADADALRDAVVAFRPEMVMTDLPDDEARLVDAADANARMRREGTRNLLAAASAAGASRLLLAQSVAWELEGEGRAAKAELERTVLHAGGVVLRYGGVYGPGTHHADPPEPPRIQIDVAARRTAVLVDVPEGIVDVTDGDVQNGLRPS